MLAPGITQTQSFTYVIQDVLFDAVAVRDPFFANYNARKTKMLAIQPNHLPLLSIYILDDTHVPDGDGNTGSIKFLFTARICFSVMVAINNPDDAAATLDAAWVRIKNVWRDQYIMNLFNTYNPNLDHDNPDNTRIESISRGVCRRAFGSAGVNNETPIAELQYEVSCVYREEFEPIITDDLLEIRMRTGIKIGETEEEMNQRPQINARYIFTPEEN